jgi:hypothetical protein
MVEDDMERGGENEEAPIKNIQKIIKFERKIFLIRT